jgi:ComF family protein
MVNYRKYILSTLPRLGKLDNWFEARENSCLLFSRCRLCSDVVVVDGLCEACIADLPVLARKVPIRHRHIDSLWSGYRYEFPIDWLIREAKFGRSRGVARFLAKRLAIQLRDVTDRPDFLIPIPMPWPRLLWRGYNQAQILATELGRHLNISVCTDLLSRRGWQAPQSGLSAQQRRQNLRHVFRATNDLSGSHIVLVDDVYTTGATTSVAAKCLAEVGATRIDVWVVATA